MHNIVRTWIADVLKAHPGVMAIAMRQRAKFEGWLKFALAAHAEESGATDVAVEAGYEGSQFRSDVFFAFKGCHHLLELKTPNTNYRMPGVQNMTRPITKNIADIIKDVEKFRSSHVDGLMAFVLFPVRAGDTQWQRYLQRISKATGINLSPTGHCCRVTVALGAVQFCDAVVCCFPVRAR
ncbi:MAG: hypothetical protein QGH60_24210 [Phycisphaerae bacterium]|jgi:hypothetical protein|nr:hypothetical protein [Phycisphaerae bacterium]